MLLALVAASLAAKPMLLYVPTIAGPPETASDRSYWTQVLAHELRRWGLRVTTQEDLTAVATGNKQRQAFGCEDGDCGIDSDVLANADGQASITVAGDKEGPYFVTLKILHAKASPKWDQTQPWASLFGSYPDPGDAFREMVPQLIAQLRRDAEPGQLRDQPAAAVGGPPAARPRRCSVTGAEALATLALLFLTRRRS